MLIEGMILFTMYAADISCDLSVFTQLMVTFGWKTLPFLISSNMSNFSFMPSGEFVGVRLSVNLFQDNQVTIRESLVCLDPKIVNAEIQKEYSNAIA